MRLLTLSSCYGHKMISLVFIKGVNYPIVCRDEMVSSMEEQRLKHFLGSVVSFFQNQP